MTEEDFDRFRELFNTGRYKRKLTKKELKEYRTLARKTYEK